jgi:hypothetical protein
MGNVTTASQTSAPSNPDVNPTVSKLLQGVQSEFGKTPAVFNQSLYPGAGSTTQQGWGRTSLTTRRATSIRSSPTLGGSAVARMSHLLVRA